MKNTTLLSLVAATALVSSQVFAAPVTFKTSSEQSLQEIIDGVTVSGPNCPNSADCHSSVDVNTDQTNLSYASVNGSGQASSQLVIEVAGNASTNSMGIYDASNPSNKIQLFGGPASQGYKSTLSILANGDVQVQQTAPDGTPLSYGKQGTFASGNDFGFYLDTASNGTFYSDASLNEDGHDHFVAFEGNGDDKIAVGDTWGGKFDPSEYIFGWEDLSFNNGSDSDYNDFVGIIESISPVPEPSTIGIFGIGLLGLGMLAGRRRRSRAN